MSWRLLTVQGDRAFRELGAELTAPALIPRLDAPEVNRAIEAAIGRSF